MKRDNNMKELTIYVAADVFTPDLLRTYATPLFRYYKYEYFDHMILISSTNSILSRKIPDTTVYDVLFLDPGFHDRVILSHNELMKYTSNSDCKILLDLNNVNSIDVLENIKYFLAYFVRKTSEIIVQYDEEAAQFMIKLKNDSGGYNIEIL